MTSSNLFNINPNQITITEISQFLPTGELSPDPLEYNNKSSQNIIYFNNGNFSSGDIQHHPNTQLQAEFAFIHENNRLRLIQLFNQNSNLEKITLIQEKINTTDITENIKQKPTLNINNLLGEWQGEAITIYPDIPIPDIYPTTLQLSINTNGELQQKLTFGKDNPKTIASTAKITDKILYFHQSFLPIQVIMLPNGASATFPPQIQPQKPFFLEAGWLINTNLRQRIIRNYNKGKLTSLTLVTENKITN